jgi:hypothetical protein
MPDIDALFLPLDDKLPNPGSGAEKDRMTECPKCGMRYAIK